MQGRDFSKRHLGVQTVGCKSNSAEACPGDVVMGAGEGGGVEQRRAKVPAQGMFKAALRVQARVDPAVYGRH